MTKVVDCSVVCKCFAENEAGHVEARRLIAENDLLIAPDLVQPLA